MLKMIKYNLKKNSLFILISTVICLTLTVIRFNGESFITEWVLEEGTSVFVPVQSPINFIMTVACILCTVIPILEFSFKMKKINIDQMYSLPIKREKIYIANLISGFIKVLIPIIVIYIYCMLIISFSHHLYDSIYFLPYFFVLIGFMAIIYLIVSFMFTRGNTIRDGIVNIFASIFVVQIIMEVLYYTVLPRNNWLLRGGNYLYSPISCLTDYFENLLKYKNMANVVPYIDKDFDFKLLVPIILYIVLGIAAAVLFVILNKEDKAENSMQISDSWFSYRTMIPIYFSCAVMLIFENGDVTGLVILLIVAYVAYVIYRRSLKIKKWDCLVIIICFISSILVYLICDSLIKVDDAIVLHQLFK